MGSQVRVLYCPPYKSSEITWFRNFFFVSWFKKFGIAETTIRLNRLYDKNTTVLQKWREKEPSGSLSLLRLYGLQRLSQRVRRCVIIDPFQHSGVAVSKQICNQVLGYALRRPERCSCVPKLMGRQRRNFRMCLDQILHKGTILTVVPIPWIIGFPFRTVKNKLCFDLTLLSARFQCNDFRLCFQSCKQAWLQNRNCGLAVAILQTVCQQRLFTARI